MCLPLGQPLLGSALYLQGPRRGDHRPDLPEPYAALLTGILLRIETGIPRELYERFNATGTSHIIVISGFNSIAMMLGVACLFVGPLR